MGEFTFKDVIVKLLSREPRDGVQVVTFVYSGPFFSEVTTEDIFRELNPRMSYGGGEPCGPVDRKEVKKTGFHETVGVIFEVYYPEGQGDSVITIATADGPITIGLGDAADTFRYAEEVRSGVKVNLRPGPSVKTSPIRVLEGYDIVFPTGEREIDVVETGEGSVEWLLFQHVTTPLGEDGWVIDDDAVFEYVGYMEAGK